MNGGSQWHQSSEEMVLEQRILPQVRKLEGGTTARSSELNSLDTVPMWSDVPGSEEIVLQFPLLFPGFPLVETVPSQHSDEDKRQTDS